MHNIHNDVATSTVASPSVFLTDDKHSSNEERVEPHLSGCVSDTITISRMTAHPQSWVDKMMLSREGNYLDSGMRTHGLHTVVKGDNYYRVLKGRGLQPIAAAHDAIDLEREVITNRHDLAPAHASFVANWDTRIYSSNSGENALGDNGLLTLISQNNMLDIPVLEADRSSLLYYGATLIDDQSIVRFPNTCYPIWHVGIGKNYVDGYIMSEHGNGFYLEYHNDRPHWHQPLSRDCGGIYVLAKQVAHDQPHMDHYHITGFRIPYGFGLYSGNGIIHCDACLTGSNWLMGYDDSDDFSTVLIRNTAGDMVKLVPQLN